MGKIKIIKEKKSTTDYTFLNGEDPNLGKPSGRKEEESNAKKKAKRDFRLRGDAKISKLKKSRITGGHDMQGHSPVYE